MKYHIRQAGEKLEIKVDEVGPDKDRLLQAFQQCRQGQCACPSDEYIKLASIELDSSGDSLTLELKCRRGLQLDPDEIEKCLAYTTARAVKADKS